MGKRKKGSMPKMLEDPDADKSFSLHLQDPFSAPPGVPGGHTNFSSSLFQGEVGWLYQSQSFPVHYYSGWQLQGTPSLFRLSMFHPF